MRQRHLRPTERAILWPDAIGLGLFTGIGVDRALALGQPALVAVVTLLPIWPLWGTWQWLEILLVFASLYQVAGWMAVTRLVKKR